MAGGTFADCANAVTTQIMTMMNNKTNVSGLIIAASLE